MAALMKDLQAQMIDMQARLERQDKSVKGRLDRLDSKDLDLTRRVSALDHKYVSIAGVAEVLKDNQLETEKWVLSSLSQKTNR